MRTITITSEFITLGQFLKFAGIVDYGGQAKEFLQNHEIKINGENENRRGRKLYPGYEVVIDGDGYVVRADDSKEA